MLQGVLRVVRNAKVTLILTQLLSKSGDMASFLGARSVTEIDTIRVSILELLPLILLARPFGGKVLSFKLVATFLKRLMRMICDSLFTNKILLRG